jgi:hypothetical protein
MKEWGSVSIAGLSEQDVEALIVPRNEIVAQI